MSPVTSTDPASSPAVSDFVEPPRTWGGILRQIGPGLIITASIVGSGELIFTTKLGSEVGFTLLWFIVLGCVIKVFVQIELGRYALAHRQTTIQAMDSIPGPRLVVSWLVYVWMAMYVATFFQLAGIVGAIADVFRVGGSNWSMTHWAMIVTFSCALLLAIGRYRLVEKSSTMMVALFTLFTMFAVGGLYWTPYAITPDNLLDGMRLQLPEHFTTAFAAFGVIGVGASELIYYPYWCLEKGYGRNAGPNDGTPEWQARADGWLRVLKTDAWVSMVIYTGATVAFYLLGAAVLHGKKIEVTDDNLVSHLSQMYLTAFGAVGLWIFLLGSFVVLYSTVFISTASNARLLVDLLRSFHILPDSEASRDRWIRRASVCLPLVYLVMFLTVGKPLSLAYVGALAQAVMLPLLCGAAIYFRHQRIPASLRPGSVWTVVLWIAALLMTAAGGYQILELIRNSQA